MMNIYVLSHTQFSVSHNRIINTGETHGLRVNDVVNLLTVCVNRSTALSIIQNWKTVNTETGIRFEFRFSAPWRTSIFSVRYYCSAFYPGETNQNRQLVRYDLRLHSTSILGSIRLTGFGKCMYLQCTINQLSCQTTIVYQFYSMAKLLSCRVLFFRPQHQFLIQITGLICETPTVFMDEWNSRLAIAGKICI